MEANNYPPKDNGKEEQKTNQLTKESFVAQRKFNPKDLMDGDGKLLKLFYPIQETAYLMSQSEKTIRRFIERGLLKNSKASRHIRITRDSILSFMKGTI